MGNKGKGHEDEPIDDLLCPFFKEWHTSNTLVLIEEAFEAGARGTGRHARPEERAFRYVRDFCCYMRIKRLLKAGNKWSDAVAQVAGELGDSERSIWRAYKRAEQREKSPAPELFID